MTDWLWTAFQTRPDTVRWSNSGQRCRRMRAGADSCQIHVAYGFPKGLRLAIFALAHVRVAGAPFNSQVCRVLEIVSEILKILAALAARAEPLDVQERAMSGSPSRGTRGRSVAWSSARMANASDDKTVRVWDAQTGRELLTFQGHTQAVASAAFSPDGTLVASSNNSRPEAINSSGDPGEPGEVKVWDARTGQERFSLKGHSRFVNSVVFSPDSKRLATLSRDDTVKVWDAQTAHELLTLKARCGFGGSVAFSPDGKRLASTSSPAALDSSIVQVKVWDAHTGQEL